MNNVKLETALNYYTHHVEPIIQWLFLAILIMCSFLILRWLLGKKEGAGADVAGSITLADGGDLQSALQKIVARTEKLERLPLENMNAAQLGAVDVQVQTLKQELAAREAEISKLKTDGAGSAEGEVLNKRVKDLESKLAEYEILEDDIADLSLYKEENARLKTELEKAKVGAPAAPIEAPVVEAPVTQSEDIVAEFAQAVGDNLGASDSKPSPEDPMAEFESAMRLEKKMTGGEALEVAPVPDISAADVSSMTAPIAPPPPTDPAVKPEGDDLFAEFATPPEINDQDVSSSLDTEKMMNEMEALVNMDPGQAGSGLEETSDIEKMALEANNLSKS